MIIHCAYKELVATSSLRRHPRNPNKHSKEQIERLAKILKYQGWRYPIKVSNQTGYITSGHARLEAAILNGWHEVPVDKQDYEDETQEIADVTSDNAIASWAELDLSIVNEDVGALGPDFDLELLGIKDFTIDVAEKFSEMDVEPKGQSGDTQTSQTVSQCPNCGHVLK